MEPNSAAATNDFFPAPLKITAEQRLTDFCTTELGMLVFEGGVKALTGNPLLVTPLDTFGCKSKQLNWTDSATTLKASCTDRYIAFAAKSSLTIYDLQKGSTLRELHGHDGSINDVAWHKESPWLLASVGTDCTLRIWDLRSHPAQIAIRRSARPYGKLEYSPDCNYIGCAGELISIFNLSMAQNVVNMLSSAPATAIQFNPAECLLATSGDDRVIRFWDMDTGECVTQSPAFETRIGRILFEPSGRYLLAGTGKHISSIGWEPFALLSQIHYSQRVQFPSPTSSPASKVVGNNEPRNLLPTILDMRIEHQKLHQLVVSTPDSSKTSVLQLVTVPLIQLETSGVQVQQQQHIQCTSTAHSAAEPTNTIAQALPTAPTTTEEPTTAAKAALIGDEPSPASVNSLDGAALVDSVVVQLEQATAHAAVAANSPDKMPKLPLASTAEGKCAKMRRGSSATSVPSAKVQQQPSTSTSSSASAQAKMRRTAKEHHPAAGGHTPMLKRPDQLGTLPASAANGGKRKSIIRRGSSLNDVTNSTSAMGPTTTTHQQTPNPIKNVNLAKGHAHFDSGGTTSSCNTSASNSSGSSFSVVEAGLRKGSEPETSSFDEFLQIDPKIQASVQKIGADMRRMLLSANSVGEDKSVHLVSQAARLEEPHLFAKLLRTYMRQTRSHTLSLNAAFLPRVNALLTHRNESYMDLALHFLEVVLDGFGDSIRHGLASRDFTIGVDVAAEQRYERCVKCKNALMQIRINSAFCGDRLEGAQRQRFDRIAALIDSIFVP